MTEKSEFRGILVELCCDITWDDDLREALTRSVHSSMATVRAEAESLSNIILFCGCRRIRLAGTSVLTGPSSAF